MIRRISILGILLLLLLSFRGTVGDMANHKFNLDTLGNYVELVFQENLPYAYKSEVFTPVCGDGECLPVRIDLFWNLDGRYWKFELPESEILTKAEHEHFSEKDYLKLNDILKDSLSPLRKFQVLELESHIDGTTGPTELLPSNSFVNKAIYTSITLWHLVHDSSHVLKRHTQEVLIPNYSRTALISNHPSMVCVSALNSAPVAEDEVLELLDLKYQNELPFILRNIPPVLYERDAIQEQLITLYKENITPINIELDEVWLKEVCPEKTILSLIDNIPSFPHLFNISYRILDHKNSWSEAIYFKLVDYLKVDFNLSRNAKMKELLEKRLPQANRKVKKYYSKN